jgi:hypothetical protein
MIGHIKDMSTPWRKLNEFPPPLVRCLAREKLKGKAVRALSDEEVALGSGSLTVMEVQAVSRQVSWDSIPIGIAKAFCKGCLFDPFSAGDRNRAGAYMRSNPQFTFLKCHPHWQKTFLPLVKLYKNGES